MLTWLLYLHVPLDIRCLRGNRPSIAEFGLSIGQGTRDTGHNYINTHVIQIFSEPSGNQYVFWLCRNSIIIIHFNIYISVKLKSCLG
jgi:hypothetical protein